MAGSAGEAFASRLGAMVGDELVDEVLIFGTIDAQQMQTLCLPPAGYALRHWASRAPDSLVASYARVKRSIADAPHRHPPPVPDWDTALVRADEQTRADRHADL